MIIDLVSQNLITIALYLDSKTPGLVSEIWIDQELVSQIRKQLPTDSEIGKLLNNTLVQIKSVTDPRRREYLQGIFQSLHYQLLNPDSKCSDFTQNTFGYRIDRVTETELRSIEDKIKKIEKQVGLSRQEICQKYSLTKDQYQQTFSDSVTKVKSKIPKYLLDFPDSGFIFDTTTNQPWTAFNSHIAPFKSKLTINLDSSFTRLDLFRLASHEAYGGHHTELSNKDKLLQNEGRGEHGLVITYSPQAFVSEAIAEGMLTILNLLDQDNPDVMVAWYYDRLVFALHNLATFLFFEDKLSKNEVGKQLAKYSISDKTRGEILNFATDPLYGRYAPVYYSAYNFIGELFSKTKDKEKLIKTLFTQPCTPNLLIKKI